MIVRPNVDKIKVIRECHGAGSSGAVFIEISKDDGDSAWGDFLVEEFDDVFQKVPSGVCVFSVCQHDLLLSVKCGWA